MPAFQAMLHTSVCIILSVIGFYIVRYCTSLYFISSKTGCLSGCFVRSAILRSSLEPCLGCSTPYPSSVPSSRGESTWVQTYSYGIITSFDTNDATFSPVTSTASILESSMPFVSEVYKKFTQFSTLYIFRIATKC
jgi:hypothetical protein